jgi:hypothetical protein
MELVPTLPRERLDRVRPAAIPGCYLQFLAAPHLAPVLGELAATGRYPAYVGVAAVSLRDRLGRYPAAIADLNDIEPTDIHIALLPCSSTASARFAEAALIQLLAPLLNGFGWGSRPPGSGRPGRRCSPISALLPGRNGILPVALVDQARARMRVIAKLARLDPYGPRWEALPTEREPC